MKPFLPNLCLPLLVLALASLQPGCGSSPARSDVPVTPATPLTGNYDAAIHTGITGPITMTMIAQPTEDGIKANTRPGVAWSLVGGLEGTLGPLLAPFIFPSGMIITWESSLPRDGAPGEGTIGIGSLSALRVATRMRSTSGPVELVYKDGRVLGLFTLTPQSQTPTHADYPALADAVARDLPALMYDPAQTDSPAIRAYLQDLRAGALKAQDDLEFLFAAGAAGRANIKTGVPLILPRAGQADSESLVASYNALAKPYKVDFDPKTQIATLRVDAFVEMALVDEAFAMALNPSPKALILDLGTSPGINLASLRVLSWLLDDDTDAGMWFAAGSRAEVLRDPKAALAHAPTLTLDDDTTVSELEASLASHGRARVIVKPRATPFLGPVVLLTTKRTSASSEALACILAKRKRVYHIGETSAGRPFLSREVPAGQNWFLRANAYDYVPPDGQMISGKGLRPNRFANRDNAPKLAAAELLRQLQAATP